MRQLLEKYLRQTNHLSISTTDLALQLVSHPDHPSVKAITDTLDYFGVENLAVSVPKDSISELPRHFLALLNEKGGNEIVLTTQLGNRIKLEYEGSNVEKPSREKFIDQWTGTCIVIEPAARKEKLQKSFDVKVLSIVGVSVLLIAAGIHSLNSAGLFVLGLSLAGVYLSYLALNEELGQNNKMVARMCSSLGNSSGCKAVINTKSGTLPGGILLSDLSFSYFAGYALLLALFGFNVSYSALLSLAGIPFLLFSLYQQAWALKQWCALCLGIGLLMVLHAVFVFYELAGVILLPVDIAYFTKATMVLSVAFAVVMVAKPWAVDHLQLGKTKFEFLKFKRNQNLFTTLLHQHKLSEPFLVREAEIVFGAKDPTVVLTMVSNPLCGYCVAAFKAYDKILSVQSNKVQIRLILSVPISQLENPATQIALRLLEVYYETGPKAAWLMLQNWFDNRDVDGWMTAHGRAAKPSMWFSTLEIHKNWCDKNDIRYTPATVIDGYLFPKEYFVEDLPLLIGDLLLEKNIDARERIEVLV